MPKRVILTGIGGFIGSHCLEYFLKNTDWEIIGIDSFRHKGILRRIDSALDKHLSHVIREFLGTGRDFIDKQVEIKDRVKIYYHDLSVPISPQLENLLLERRIDEKGVVIEKPIDYIINMASDSAVERSVTDPTHCARNNYELALNMLEFARRIKPKKYLQISTDECYGEAEFDSPGHKEWASIIPSNVYAASKAAQEALSIAYWRTYDVPIIITNCMNIIAEWQDKEKFLPKLIQYVYTGKEMPIYGDSPKSIGTRVYLHAKNKADALIFILCNPVALYSEGAKRPDRYNICGEDELSNLDLAQMVAEIMGKELKYKLIPSESARPGYDRRYALDGGKLKNMGWVPPLSFRQSLESIIKWTLNHQEWLI
jgi:dTDP-glucose 4,6-dehydratase